MVDNEKNDFLSEQGEDEFDTTGLSVKLTNFEGPLDLLLHLVKDAKIEIKDIFVSEVTNQFLLYMSQISAVDVSKASEYMAMAATLIEIKSRSLLPVFDTTDASLDNPEDILIRQLEEYKIFKEASEKLREFEDVNRLYKAADQSVGNVRLIAKDMSLDGLLDAFANMLHRIDIKESDKQPKEIKRDQYSVTEKIDYIQDRLSSEESVSFFSLFDADSVSRNEIVVTFSALLELLKIQYIRVAQGEFFNDIVIKLNPNYKDDDVVLDLEQYADVVKNDEEEIIDSPEEEEYE